MTEEEREDVSGAWFCKLPTGTKQEQASYIQQDYLIPTGFNVYFLGVKRKEMTRI